LDDGEAAHLNVIFLQEINDSNVVFERHLVRHGEDIQIRHITSIRLDRLEDILRKTDGIQLEVGFEQQIDNVINAPFSRVFKWCSETQSVKVDEEYLGIADLSARQIWNILLSCRAASSSFSFFSASELKSSWKVVIAPVLFPVASSALMANILMYLPATYRQGTVQASNPQLV
jgi:hypothetical protein